MKIIKAVLFFVFILWLFTTMNDNIKGEGIVGSFWGIVVVIGFSYGAYKLFYSKD